LTSMSSISLREEPRERGENLGTRSSSPRSQIREGENLQGKKGDRPRLVITSNRGETKGPVRKTTSTSAARKKKAGKGPSRCRCRHTRGTSEGRSREKGRRRGNHQRPPFVITFPFVSRRSRERGEGENGGRGERKRGGDDLGRIPIPLSLFLVTLGLE